MNKYSLLLVVVIIIGIVFVLKEISFAPKEQFLLMRARNKLVSLSEELKRYKEICGSYPSTEDGLSVLFSGERPKDCESYINSENIDLKDEWGNDFIYHSDGSSYRLQSMLNVWLEVRDGSVPEIVEKED